MSKKQKLEEDRRTYDRFDPKVMGADLLQGVAMRRANGVDSTVTLTFDLVDAEALGRFLLNAQMIQ